MNIGILGGAFDPPHYAHVLMAAYAHTAHNLDCIYVVPCWHHAFAKDVGLHDFDHRMQMCNRAFDPQHGYVRVMDVEAKLQSRYTIDLIKHLRETYPDDRFTLIIGSDNVPTLPEWHRWEDLKGLVDFFVIPRPGSASGLFSFPDVSSTQVRKLFKENRLDEAGSLIPPDVLRYVVDHDLYTEGA